MMIMLCLQYTAASTVSSSRPIVLKRDEHVCVQNSKETQQHSHNSNTCNLTLQPGQSTSHVSDCSDDPLCNRRESRSSQVVYASLHHHAPTPSSTTSRQTQEEFSEYASIRVSWFSVCLTTLNNLFKTSNWNSEAVLCNRTVLFIYSLWQEAGDVCMFSHWVQIITGFTFLITSWKINAVSSVRFL